MKDIRFSQICPKCLAGPYPAGWLGSGPPIWQIPWAAQDFHGFRYKSRRRQDRTEWERDRERIGKTSAGSIVLFTTIKVPRRNLSVHGTNKTFANLFLCLCCGKQLFYIWAMVTQAISACTYSLIHFYRGGIRLCGIFDRKSSHG